MQSRPVVMQGELDPGVKGRLRGRWIEGGAEYRRVWFY